MRPPWEPEPGGGGGGGSRGEDPPDLTEEYADVFDCGALEVSCHVSKWFHGLVVGVLEPFFGWIAQRAFTTHGPTTGITGAWEGTLATINLLYVLFVLATAFVLMAHHSVQAQYGARELLPRLVVGWVAANVSLTVVALSAEVSTAIARAIVEDGMNSATAAENLREKSTPFLGLENSMVVIFLLVFVILIVVWLLAEIVRMVIVILLMVGGPLMLAFHALPYTNRVAQMWWRALGGVMLVPIAQAIAYVALTRIFFEGDTAALFGLVDMYTGGTNLVDLFLLLVLVYVQIRIPMWAYKAVWSPPPARMPGAGLAKTAVTAVVLSVLTGGAAGAATAGGYRTRRIGRLLRARSGRSTAHTRTAALPRRVRTWRFGKPGTHHGSTSPGRTRPSTARSDRSTAHPPRERMPAPHERMPDRSRPPHQPGTRSSSTPPHRPTTVPTPEPLPGRHRQPPQTGQPTSGRTQPRSPHSRPNPQPSGAHPPPPSAGSGRSGRPSTPGRRKPSTWLPRRRAQGPHRRPRPAAQRRWWRR